MRSTSSWLERDSQIWACRLVSFWMVWALARMTFRLVTIRYDVMMSSYNVQVCDVRLHHHCSYSVTYLCCCCCCYCYCCCCGPKIFMRDSQKFVLQNKLQDEVLSRIVMIQRWLRAKLIRCRYVQILNSVLTIQVQC